MIRTEKQSECSRTQVCEQGTVTEATCHSLMGKVGRHPRLATLECWLLKSNPPNDTAIEGQTCVWTFQEPIWFTNGIASHGLFFIANKQYPQFLLHLGFKVQQPFPMREAS